MFSEGREDVNDEERAGRPSTSTTDEKINEVEKMILANRRITVREVAEDLNISIGLCHSIFINDLGMRRVAAKFVPKLLNCDQKQHRMNIANEMLDSVRDDPNLLQRVITGDEAWVYGYDVETKAQSSQWKLPHEPRPKNARQVRSNVKVLLTVFFDCRGVVHHEFLPQGRTVNKEYYLQVMRNLREAIRQKRPDLWKNKNWLLHHDNAPAHTSLLVRDFLAKNNTLVMPQPPHIHVKCNSTCVRSVVMKSNREFENRAAIIVALRAGRSPKEIVDFLKLPKTTIYRVKKQFDEADSNKEGIATRKKHSRRSDRVRGEEFVKNVKEKIDGNPGKSMRAIAKEMDVGTMTIVRTIHEDLGLKSYALRKEIPVVMHTKFPASVMVLGVISSEGDVMPPHFFEKGLRMNADTYINVLETVVKPWMDMVAAGRKYVFQQDSAPAHMAKKTQSWLTLNVPSHWGPDIWPPNSPDCNPLDYYVWGVVERDVNKAPHTTIQSVKKAVHTVMTQMDK
ncbi:hypothetical protein LAZ67_2003761, partial [Cordylochernes scorpioides]